MFGKGIIKNKVISFCLLGLVAFSFSCVYPPDHHNQIDSVREAKPVDERKYRKEDLNEALFDAAAHGRPQVIKVLISAGANINSIRDDIGNTPLINAVNSSNEDTMRALIELGADVNVANSIGRTALRYAVHYGLFEIMKTLIEKGANINSQDISGVTPLIQAVWHNESRMVRYLVDKGADINIKDSERHSALFYADESKNKEVSEILKLGK
ncbi:MAG: ankyrin repeat domain-containing protein [Nitrospirae bacterium]|nr:ankyrin repeat domain-containing protein [Nitrospirota bacterium]MBI3351986.1 ankyrin repeat domain-containing protein [Nitrospirota bacterium]